MTYLPDPPEEPPDEELTPQELHDRWESVTNLQADDLKRLKKSERNEIYLDENSEQAQEGNEPLNDAIRLAETPADEWSAEDDGFNEVEQAREALNFIDRTAAQGAEKEQDGAMIESKEPHYGRQEMSLARWGVDPFPRDEFP